VIAGLRKETRWHPGAVLKSGHCRVATLTSRFFFWPGSAAWSAPFWRKIAPLSSLLIS